MTEFLKRHVDARIVLDGTVPLIDAGNLAVSPTSSGPAVEVVFPILHVAANTETLVYKSTRKIEIVGVEVLKDATDAGGTVQLTDSSDVAITDAIAAAVDKAVTRAATIAKTVRIIAAGGTFKVIYTKGSGTSASQLLIRALLRA